MQLYLIVIISFLIVNFLLSILLEKYSFFKFFIFVITYFALINFVNLIYFGNVDFFAFQVLFFVSLLFLYVGLYSSVSVKIMIYLYSKKVGVNVNNFYETEFKQNSFNKRIDNLINDGILVKKNKYIKLSKGGKKYLKIFKIIHSIYRVKVSG